MGNAGIIHSILYTILLISVSPLSARSMILPLSISLSENIPPALHFCKKTPLSAYDMYPFIQMRRT